MRRGKNYRNAVAKYDKNEKLELESAIDKVKEIKYSKFDETVEIHVALKLGRSQTLRDTVTLPHQFRDEKRVLVFCDASRVDEAIEAGATYAGGEEYIEKIRGGWLDFDVAVAVPDMMRDVGRLGPILGRRGLMPTPKTGTVTNDIEHAIGQLKKGRVEFRADRTGVIHFAIGKVSMETQKILENAQTFLAEMIRKKPADAKGDFVRSVVVCSTMGPGVKVDYRMGG